MGDDYSTQYFVALPGGLAVIVFVWWLYRELRKSRVARRANAGGPVHIVVINQDMSNVGHSSHVGGTELPVEEAAFAAYENRCSMVDGEVYHQVHTPQASQTDGNLPKETTQGTDRR
jgi:hypothetical protein